MIQTNDLNTTVFFARENGKGVISVAAFDNKLVLQQLKSPKKVSDELKGIDIQDLPRVVCDFNTIESVDVMMAILQRVKENIIARNLEHHYALAC